MRIFLFVKKEDHLNKKKKETGSFLNKTGVLQKSTPPIFICVQGVPRRFAKRESFFLRNLNRDSFLIPPPHFLHTRRVRLSKTSISYKLLRA